jgi:hypothetical protein
MPRERLAGPRCAKLASAEQKPAAPSSFDNKGLAQAGRHQEQPPMPKEITLLRSFELGYTLLDTATGKPISEPFTLLKHAFHAARHSGATTIYQQNLDLRGRPQGPAIVLLGPKANLT